MLKKHKFFHDYYSFYCVNYVSLDNINDNVIMLQKYALRNKLFCVFFN